MNRTARFLMFTALIMGLIWMIFPTWMAPVSLAGKVIHPKTISARSVPPDDEKTAEETSKQKEGLPLKPVRHLKFTTDEGTWLSLDVSPDGQSIVFELLGDLYEIPIDGGEAQPLTQGMAFDSQPRYSPDGQWIAFLSDRNGSENVWIMRRDGSEPRPLSKDKNASFASPTWTPDGQYVIVSRTYWGLRTYELWMYHIKGGKGIRITRAKPKPDTPTNRRINALGAVVSPDGRHIYFARKLGGFAYNILNFPLWQIVRHDRITGEEDPLTAALGSAFRPMISPDGRWLIYGTRFEAKTGLRVRNLATGMDRWLIYPIQRDDQESRFTRDLLPGYAFMPDGSAIVLSFNGKIFRVTIPEGNAVPIPFRVQVNLDIGPDLHVPQRAEEGPVKVRIIQDPVLSPDGRKLAFSALTRLFVMHLPDGKPHQLTLEGVRAFQPAWSPDGRWLAYVTWDSTGGHLWKIRADGKGNPIRISRYPAFYSNPAWSPDGSRIVVLRGLVWEREQRPFDFGTPPGMDLVWFPAGGGKAHLIAPAQGVGHPHFGPEPDRIYLYTAGGLISLRFDGSDRRTHLRVTGKGLYYAEKPVPADDIRISPTGDWALAHVQNQLYLVAVPRIGGKAPEVNVNQPAVPVKRLTSVGADYFAWTLNGDITWSVGSRFYQRSFTSIQFESKRDKQIQKNTPVKKNKASSGKAIHLVEDEPGVHHYDITIERPRAVPHGRLALKGGRIVTMNHGTVIENGIIIIHNNRIEQVGPADKVSIPPDAHVLDITGMTVTPGFIDTHAHWFEIRRGILDVQNWSFLANLAFGVTAGLDVQTATNDMFAYQDLVDTGEILGPRAYSTGPGIFSNNAFKTLDEVKGVMLRYRDFYHTRNLKSYLVGNRKQRQLVVQAAKELGMMPTTEGALDLKMDLTHAIDGFHGNEHALPIVPLYKDVVELFARTRISYTPTLLVAYGGPWAENYFYTTTEVHDNPKLNRFIPHHILDQKTKRRPWFRYDEHVFPKIAAQAAKILRAGGLVGVGSHGQIQGIGYHWEMWALAAGGMTPEEVLRCATVNGARIIGFEKDLGTIEVGKLADLNIFTENPLDDIHRTTSIRYVVKNGEVYEADTLKKIWPEAKSLPDMWWNHLKPPAHK